MSDLFHDKVPDEWIDRIVKVMVRARQHTFQVLTKRPERMRAYLSSRPYCVDRTTNQYADWPTPRIWWGVSVEDQATTDERIPLLLQTPAAVRWVSYEPALSGVDFDGDAYSWRGWLRGWHCEPQHARGCDGSCSGGRCPEPTQVQNERLDWVVVGGESGPGARPFDVAWARQTIAQCRAAGVPAFCKQLGAVPYILDVGGVAADPEKWPPHVRFKRLEADGCPHLFRVILRDRKGGDPEEWPRDLRVREYPHGP
jgi:hypothetical protein